MKTKSHFKYKMFEFCSFKSEIFQNYLIFEKHKNIFSFYSKNLWILRVGQTNCFVLFCFFIHFLLHMIFSLYLVRILLYFLNIQKTILKNWLFYFRLYSEESSAETWKTVCEKWKHHLDSSWWICYFTEFHIRTAETRYSCDFIYV